jgi:hypothetical protein
LARFIVVDLSEGRYIPQELEIVVPSVRTPVAPLIEASEEPFAMFADLYQRYPWVLEPYRYEDLQHLLATFEAAVIARAEAKYAELTRERRERMRALEEP